MPVTLDSTVTTTGGVALVRLRLRNTEPVARRVRLANRLDGAVCPPRRHGRPEPGWTAEGYTGVVDADARLALGYACDLADGSDANPEGPPAEVVAVADPAEAPADPLDRALADLPDSRPPADTVAPATQRRPADRRERPPRDPRAPDEAVDRPDGDPAAVPPPAVRRYLDAADRRVSRAETLASGSVAEATDALDGGCEIPAAGLDALVAADAEALARVAERAAALAERADRASVPTDALERLA